MPGALLLILILLVQSLAAQAEPCYRNFITGRNVSAAARTSKDLSEISSAFFKLLKQKVPCTYNEQNLSFQKALSEFGSYRLDLFAFGPVNEAWLKYTDTEVLYSVDRLLLVNKKVFKKGADIDYYVQNPKIRFVAISGGVSFTKPSELELLEKQKRLIYDTFPDGAIERFSKGQSDAVFTTPTYWLRHRKQFHLETMSILIQDRKDPIPIALFLSKKRLTAADRKMISEGMNALRKQGAFKKVLQAYISDEELETFYHF